MNNSGNSAYIQLKMKKKSSDIFLDQKKSSRSQQKSKDSISVPTVPYLKRGDSSVYIGQFLQQVPIFQPTQLVQPAQPSNKQQSNFISVVQEQAHVQSQELESVSQGRSQTKINPSAFHNFQKHLTVGLKHAVVMPSQDKMSKDYLRAAIKLWKAFSLSKVCTKKVLHFLLGNKNQHQTTAQDLREFGLYKIYDTFGDKVINEARIFLMKQTLRQIQDGCLQKYFEHKKIKDKEKFNRYIKMFIEELQQGFLRKRLPREKVAELMAE